MGSLLMVMLIPKALDMFLLTPLLQGIKSSDYREWFYIVHALNDGLMIVLIKHRLIVSVLLRTRNIYRPLMIEKAIIYIYATSIIYNICVFGDFFRFWRNTFNLDQAYFYVYYTQTKYILSAAEAVTLSFLTYQTVVAVRRLKDKGLIA